MRIGIVTPLFPTTREPYRGAPIWHTLRELLPEADLSSYCLRPSYPPGFGPRTFRYHREPADTSTYRIPSQTVTYFTIPGTGMWKGRLIQNALRKAWTAARPDVILSYWIHPDGHAAVRLGHEWNVPVLVGARGSDLRLMPERGAVRRQIEATLRGAAGVLCVSSELARIALATGASPDAVHTIRNGVDPAIFHWRDRCEAKRRLELSADENWVVFVGWLSKLKGVGQLAEAITVLNREGGRPWNVALIGEGYLESELRRRAAESGCESRFRFLGPLKAPEIAEWMSAADLFCLPSESEGCPNVVLEALACGTPIVATQVGGIPELVNPECGVQLSANDPETLVRGLRAAAGREWNRERIARTQQRTWRHVALETLEVCRHALARHRTAN